MAATIPAYAQNLSAEQEAKLTQLEEAVSHVAQSCASHRAFCTRATYVRYLRARSWNVHKAAKMLLATLSWRAEFKPDELRWEAICHEAKRGKLFILPQLDLDGRPVVLMRPRNEGEYEDGDDRIRWLVYQLEAASHIADASTSPSADGKMAWLIDFVGYSRKNAPPLRVSMQTLHILQNHYPERLGRAVCWQPPYVFDLLWKAVGPFVDPATREKLVFLPTKALKKEPDVMTRYFDMSDLDDSLGGEVPIAELWSYERYEVRMRQVDAQLDARLAAAAGSLVPETSEELADAAAQLAAAGAEDAAAAAAEVARAEAAAAAVVAAEEEGGAKGADVAAARAGLAELEVRAGTR
eukprot:scaffold9.g3143.t1